MRFAGRCSFVLAAFIVVACSQPHGALKLAPVAALPKPTLPAWIASISPTTQAQSLAQIRVIFAKPVAPLSALEGKSTAAVLAHVRIDPQLKGRFVLLTPKMIGFVADEALPAASRVRVTLRAGLSDLAGDRLASNLAWTFHTSPLAFSHMPHAGSSTQSTPAPLQPTIVLQANAAVDTASLAVHATLQAGRTTVALTAVQEPTSPPPPGVAPDAAGRFDRSGRSWTYDLTPVHPLAKGTRYALDIAPGVEPAHGNVATNKRFTGSIATYRAFAIVPTPTPDPSSPPSSRFASGDPIFEFNNPIDAKTLAGSITISPQPAPSPRVVMLDDYDVAIDPYALDPNTSYTVRIGAKLKDRFGQSLPQPTTVSFHTSNFSPGMWAPSGYTVIPANGGVDLNLYATNLPGNRYRSAFAALSPTQALQQVDPSSVLDAPSAWPAHTLMHASPNRQSVVRVDVQRELQARYGALAYGFQSDIAGGTSTTGVVQLTNLGVFAQLFPDGADIMVQHLDDGSPVSNATVTLYRMPDGQSPQRCATATTNAGGAAHVGGVDIERCFASAGDAEMPQLGVVASRGGDVATVSVYDYSGIYRYNVFGGWTTGAPSAAGTIFPDRDMYQPGEHGVFTGVAYYVQAGSVHADRNATMTLQLRGPSGNVTALGTARTDRYGTFSYPYTFAPAQALGYYSIIARSNRGYSLDGSFRVARFKPPNFKMTVALDKSSVAPGGTVRATGTASYLFGAPLAGGKDRVYVTRDYANLAPKGWDAFWFGRQWFWPEQQPSLDSDVLERDLSLNASGSATLDVPVAREIPAPLRYTVEMQASDVSNLSVSDLKTFLALPTDAVIGLASDTVGAANSPMPIRVIVTDPGGKPVVGRAVHLELQKMTYVSASQAQEGGASSADSIKYSTVDRADVTSSAQPVVANLTPNESGSYRVRANFSGASGDASATDMQIFAFGSTPADFGARDTDSVKVTLDKKTYKVGDTATALIGSPFPNADVYVSVIRYDTIYSTVLHDVSGAPSVHFKITPQMFPNAAIEAVVVRRGPKLASVKPGMLDSLMRTGMAPFAIDVHDRYLKLAIEPAHAKLAPGATQRVRFTLRDANGAPARGKIVAMAVNDAVLQLSGYRLPDLVTTIFAQQPISTRFADSRRGITLQTPRAPLEKGFGYGGGFLAGAAGTRVRTNFLPLAYYGTVVTDAAGHANVTFTLPDDLTTWRVMAVAIGNDDRHFGTGDATFVSQLPLMANPLLPQFARPGDRFDAGVSVLDQSAGGNALNLVLQLSGGLHFATGNPSGVQLNTASSVRTAAYRFPIVVGTPAPSTFAARAGIGTARDAFSVPFSIVDRATTESVIDAGATTAEASVPIDARRGGTYTIVLANSVVPQLSAQGRALLGRDSIGTANDLASRLIIATAIGARDKARAALASLLRLQRDDGGFAYCSYAGGSDPFASGYALEALAYARSHGLDSESRATSRALHYVASTLQNPGRNRYCTSPACEARTRFAMLTALSANGDHRSQYLQQIYAERSTFADATKLRLARYLLATAGWQGTGRRYAASLEQKLYVSGRYASANLTSLWAWRDQLVDAQAEMLRLLLADGAPMDRLDGAARALLAQQCRCGWQTAEATARAIVALDAYAKRAPAHALSARVTAAGRTVASARFGSSAGSTTSTVSSASVQGSAIVLHTTGGTLHYIVTFTYPVPSNAPGQLTAFHVVRELFDPGNPKPIATIDLAPQPALGMLTDSVFDVGLRIAVDHPVDRVVIEDPLPAGFEAVHASFATSTQSVIPQSDNWEIGERQIYPDRVMAFAQHLDPGVYEMHYLVRSVTPGEYRWPGARVYVEDAPEQFGRSAAVTLQLK